MHITRLDHLVLTVRSLETSIAFYERLGFEHVTSDGRHSLFFGDSKINLHPAAHPYLPAAAAPTPGSGDLCFVVDAPPQEILTFLEDAGVPIERGPGEQLGALGPMTSVYIRDPDGNLLEFAAYAGKHSRAHR